MADLQKQYEELIKLVTKERALQKKAEEALAVAKQATELAAATAADNIAKANAFAVQVSAAAIQKGPKMGLPDSPHLFPDDHTKVLWSLSYLDGQALEWVDQFVKKLFQAKEISYDQDFAKALVAMYFDTEKKTKAEASLCKLKQTKSTADYTHLFNTHTHHTGWETATLISHYKQGLKSNIDNEINGGDHQTSQSTSNEPDSGPNARDVSAMNGRLSNAEKSRMMKAGLCFQCGKRGHLVRDCPEKTNKGKPKDMRIAELEEEIRVLRGGEKT
ncbi:hypothetical protein PSTG_01662 [Puccinia striiformis f. sp. tritici PST-78]|uniref:CCHC-type domain-containing protein n=1 Tax=Puccinia striiformis f. sp. tritici PST-78 TaxID=1165861 RepID=A0A0L0W0J2_9BASI|nr:hypothetical protein PSTG_01662 [Puccinia striiformis f. sp. tritici PST-78]